MIAFGFRCSRRGATTRVRPAVVASEVESGGDVREQAGRDRSIWIRSTDDDDDDDDDDENELDWPTWAVAVLSGLRDVETYNHGRLP